MSQIDEGARVAESRREWLAAQRENRCVCVSGDAMAPIIADGASVAYAKEEEDVQQLDGKLVVAWLDNQPVVRWFEQCGRYALLRAQNPRPFLNRCSWTSRTTSRDRAFAASSGSTRRTDRLILVFLLPR